MYVDSALYLHLGILLQCIAREEILLSINQTSNMHIKIIDMNRKPWGNKAQPLRPSNLRNKICRHMIQYFSDSTQVKYLSKVPPQATSW